MESRLQFVENQMNHSETVWLGGWHTGVDASVLDVLANGVVDDLPIACHSVKLDLLRP